MFADSQTEGVALIANMLYESLTWIEGDKNDHSANVDADGDVDADADADGTTNDTSKSKLQQVKSWPSNDTKCSKESQETSYGDGDADADADADGDGDADADADADGTMRMERPMTQANWISNRSSHDPQMIRNFQMNLKKRYMNWRQEMEELEKKGEVDLKQAVGVGSFYGVR